MTYPTNTVSLSIYTTFIDGFKFDICEVDKLCYNLLNDKKYRYFLCVDDYICDYYIAKKYFIKTGEENWGFFCYTKSECMQKIKDFYNLVEKIKKLEEFIVKHPNLKKSNQLKIVIIKKRIKRLFSVQLH